jgi:hypothetical protein
MTSSKPAIIGLIIFAALVGWLVFNNKPKLNCAGKTRIYAARYHNFFPSRKIFPIRWLGRTNPAP